MEAFIFQSMFQIPILSNVLGPQIKSVEHYNIKWLIVHTKILKTRNFKTKFNLCSTLLITELLPTKLPYNTQLR